MELHKLFYIQKHTMCIYNVIYRFGLYVRILYFSLAHLKETPADQRDGHWKDGRAL